MAGVDRRFTKLYTRSEITPFDEGRLDRALSGVADAVGGFRQYVLPESALGREVMLAFRGIHSGEVMPEKDIQSILKDMIILKINDTKNEVSLYAPEPAEYPTPNPKITVQFVHDVVIYTMLETGFLDPAIAYLAYRSSRGLVKSSDEKDLTKEHLPFEGFPSLEFREKRTKLYEDYGVDTPGSINNLLAEDNGSGFIEIVNEFEAQYENNLMNAFELYKEKNQKNKIKAIIIAGKSSSGKTTTTHKFSDLVEAEGVNLKPFSVDNYFIEDYPKDSRGRLIYEFWEQLESEALVEDLENILAGKKVYPHKFNFKLGKSFPDQGTPIQLKENEVLVIDSHMGLYPSIRNILAPDERFIIYLQPCSRIKKPDSENYLEVDYTNMLRRWKRDFRKRGTSFEDSAYLWKYAQLGMARDTVPRMNLADIVVPSDFPGEFNFLRTLYDTNPLPDPMSFLKEADNGNYLRGKKGGELYAAIRVWQAQQILSWFDPVPMRWIEEYDVLPADSILREFVGKSIYDEKKDILM